MAKASEEKNLASFAAHYYFWYALCHSQLVPWVIMHCDWCRLQTDVLRSGPAWWGCDHFTWLMTRPFVLLQIFLFHTLHQIGLSCCCASYDRRVYFHVCFLYLSNKTTTILPHVCQCGTWPFIRCLIFIAFWRNIATQTWKKRLPFSVFLPNRSAFEGYLSRKDTVESHYRFMKNVHKRGTVSNSRLFIISQFRNTTS